MEQIGPLFIGLLLPFLLSVVLKNRSGRRIKERGVALEAGGEAGITKRNHRFPHLLEAPWEGASTLAAIFEHACLSHGSQPFLGTRELISKDVEPGEDGRMLEKLAFGPYKWITYAGALERARDFASGLAALGVQKGERCAIFAETRADWLISLQGCFRRSLSVVTVYASLGEEALAHSLNETEVSTVISDKKQLRKLYDMSQHLDTVKRVIVMEDEMDTSKLPVSGSWKIVSFTEVEHLGQETPVEADFPLATDVAVIMYTSGSTGLPKGVMITHGNMTATVAGIINVIPGIGQHDTYLAYLPLAHVLELAAEGALCAAGGAIGYGSPLTLTDASSKIKKGTKGDISELKPTLIAAVPAILDRIRDGVRKNVEAKGGIAKALFSLAYRRRLAAIEGSWFGAWGLEKYLWNNLVFRKVRPILGGRIRGMLSGGAPLSRDTQRFINICFGAPIGQGYGLTESCAGATISEWDDTSVGRVGPPVPQCYVKLINWEGGGYRTSDYPMPRGEIVVGGPCVTLGYFKNQLKTDEVFKMDERGIRWFYTGDIGQFHPDGCLEIIDRKKDIVKLQHGEYVSLGKVESILIASQYVENIMLHADPFHSFCVALVVVSHSAVESWAQKENIQYTNFVDLCDRKETLKEVLASLQKVGKAAKLEKFEVPSKLKLLADPWTPETGLVTAALKLKREILRKNFSYELTALYA